MTWTAQAQPLFLAGVLGWSGLAKALGGDPAGQVAGTALHRLLGGRISEVAYVALGVGEAVLALAFLAAPGRPVAFAAVALTCGFLAYLTYAALATPQSSCGCLGKKKVRLSWRAFARVGLLLAAASIAAEDAPAWWQSPPLISVALLLVAQGALFVALSAELDRLWLTPLRRLRVRLLRPLAVAGTPDADAVPLQATLSALVRSRAYREASTWLASDVLEHWDADGWRILVYSARLPDRRATAVFAVPLADENLDAIRVTLVDEEEALAVAT